MLLRIEEVGTVHGLEYTVWVKVEYDRTIAYLEYAAFLQDSKDFVMFLEYKPFCGFGVRQIDGDIILRHSVLG